MRYIAVPHIAMIPTTAANRLLHHSSTPPSNKTDSLLLEKLLNRTALCGRGPGGGVTEIKHASNVMVCWGVILALFWRYGSFL